MIISYIAYFPPPDILLPTTIAIIIYFFSKLLHLLHLTTTTTTIHLQLDTVHVTHCIAQAIGSSIPSYRYLNFIHIHLNGCSSINLPTCPARAVPAALCASAPFPPHHRRSIRAARQRSGQDDTICYPHSCGPEGRVPEETDRIRWQQGRGTFNASQQFQQQSQRC